jgi:hypothetical protein
VATFGGGGEARRLDDAVEIAAEGQLYDIEDAYVMQRNDRFCLCKTTSHSRRMPIRLSAPNDGGAALSAGLDLRTVPTLDIGGQRRPDRGGGMVVTLASLAPIAEARQGSDPRYGLWLGDEMRRAAAAALGRAA